MAAVEISLAKIGELLSVPVRAGERTFARLSDHQGAGPEAIVFAVDEKSLRSARESGAGLILAPLLTDVEDDRVLCVRNPKLAFARIGQWMDGFAEAAVHPAAVIAKNAEIGRGSAVGPGTVIEDGVKLGEGCRIGANVTLCTGTAMGDRVLVQAGTVLGGLGFGYVTDEEGRHIRFPQQGRLVIEDDVEIGANTTIDRGALGETRIGAGTKIDNGVHIGHNCVIGKNVLIAAQVGISGSCSVGDGAVLAGQVGLGDHVTIGPGVILGGAAGVFPGKRLDGPGEMFMGVPAVPLREYLKTTARLRRGK